MNYKMFLKLVQWHHVPINFRITSMINGINEIQSAYFKYYITYAIFSKSIYNQNVDKMKNNEYINSEKRKF